MKTEKTNDPVTLNEVAPMILTPDWHEVQCPVKGGRAWMCENGLLVIASALIEDDGKRWLHVSLSRRTRLPSWADMHYVKDQFIGRQNKAIQVFPPAREYVNTHPNCLHLFRCLDGDGIPDFRVHGEL